MAVEGPVRQFQIGETDITAAVGNIDAGRRTENGVAVVDVLADRRLDAVELGLLGVQDHRSDGLAVDETVLVGEHGVVALDVPRRRYPGVRPSGRGQFGDRNQSGRAPGRASGFDLVVSE